MPKLRPIFLALIAVFATIAMLSGRASASPIPQLASGAKAAPAATRSQKTPHAKHGKKLSPNVAQDLVANPSGLDFGKQIAGTTSAAQTIVVTNSSTTDTVQVSSVGFDTDVPGFTETSDCVGGITPGGTCSISVSFAPQQGTVCFVTPNLVVNDDDPGGTLSVSLFGEAAAAGGLVTADLTDGTLTPASLAQSLVGTGVTISNVKYTGVPLAAGTFSNGSGIIGFDKGIILSNGAVSNVLGPNCDTGITGDNQQPGDQDLTNLICTDPTSCADPSTTNDAAALEFDFVPTSSLLTFQYVFASDEYPEFVFDFNDVFAFFLSQNGTPLKDIALIPGTNTIVSINNVNNGNPSDPDFAGVPPVNPQFYIDNNFQQPTAAPLNTEMDGLTTVLSVQSPVVPGQTYHIKLAIADALDFVLDSNVFIKGGSLSSTNLSIAPPALGFGSQNINSTSKAQSVTISNVGSAPISGVAIAATGPFAQTNNCPTTLAVAPATGSSCVISVTFTPTTGAPANGTITITDSAPDSPQTVTVGGTGISGAFVTTNPFSLTFPPGTPGVVSPPQAITITNSGASELTISSITSTNDSFNETDNCVGDGVTIPAKGTCTINVTYDPAQAGQVETGQLLLVDNAQSNGQQQIGLTGNATSSIAIVPGNIAFGNQAINTVSAPQTVTFTNTGTSPVTIPSVVVGAGFTETNTCTAAAIPAGGNCTVSVTFTPTTATTFSTDLTFTDTAPNSPQVVALTGTGTATANETLTITEGGTGTGTVTSSPAGISCKPTCTANFASGTVVTLTAAPATGSTFTGWSGANSCEGTGTCTFTITAATTVTANFGGGTTNFALTVTEAGTGTGTVTSSPAGISCKPTCSANFASGTAVTLTATPATGSTFTGWSAPCEGTGSCTITVTAATTVTATFGGGTSNFALTVTEAGTGTGTVTSAPAGISCKPTCTANFASGTQVTLSQSAAEGSVFAGWSGACTGTGACVVAMTAAESVTATFNNSSNSVIISVPSGGSTTASTTPGGTAFFGLLISGGPGVTGTVQLTCASSSPSITCKVVPSTVTLNGNGTTEVAFGIQTFCQGSTTAGGFVPPGFGGGIAMLLMTLMVGGIAGMFNRDRRIGVAFAMVVMFAALGVGSCASLPKGPNGATQPGTYFITLSTTLNGQTQTLPNFLTLMVKQP